MWTLFVHIFFISTFGQNLTKFKMEKKHTSFGELLRSLREETGQSLKTVAKQIQMDTSLLAKIERNERHPTKHIIKQISSYFNVNEKELQSESLSDQIAFKILNEDADLATLKAAAEKVVYLKTIQNGK